MFKLLDRFDLADAVGKALTAEGYLDIPAKISRAGVYEYNARELGQLFADRDPNSIVRVYRSEDEVFKPSSMSSFQKKPVTDGHPIENVTAENSKEHTVGLSSENMRRDGNFVAGSLLLMHKDAIEKVRSGQAELSAGYDADITRQAGTFQGIAYDAVMTNITGNHIALVDAGRCGPLCRVGDRAPTRLDQASVKDCGCSTGDTMNAITPPATQAVVHDGFTGLMDTVGATMFGKLRDQHAALQKAMDTLQGTHDAAVAKHTKEIADRDVEIKKLKDSVPDAAALDKLVADRQTTVDAAARILGDDFKADGKSVMDIKRAVVAEALNLDDAAVKAKSEGYIDASFDTVVAQLGDEDTRTGKGERDDVRDAFRAGGAQPGQHRDSGGGKLSAKDKARAEHIARISGNWKGDTQKKTG